MQYFPTAEGYVDHTKVQGSSVYNYIYQYKDHLGNIRMNYTFDAVNGDIKITEESHYYPFGLKHRNYNNAEFQYREFNTGVRLLNRDKPQIIIDPNPFVKGEYDYKYNGKEWQSGRMRRS